MQATNPLKRGLGVSLLLVWAGPCQALAQTDPPPPLCTAPGGEVSRD